MRLFDAARRWLIAARGAGESLPFNQQVVVTGVVVGLATGSGAYLFHRLLETFEVFDARILGLLGGAGVIAWRVARPALGGLLNGWVLQHRCPEARGHGVKEVVEAIREKGGHIPARVAWGKSLASAATIGSGGSAGLEGPVVQIGASLGSWLGRFLEVGARDMPVFVAAGAVGGLSAAFGVPLAGLFFTMEVVLRDFANEAFPAVVVSSVTAAMSARLLLGEGGFVVPVQYQASSLPDLPLFALTGLLCAALGRFYNLAIESVEGWFAARSSIPESIKPGVGGLLVGGLSVGMPTVGGTGRPEITEALSGGLTGVKAALLSLAKVAATALTLGSGGSGGSLMPSLTVGSAAGSASGAAYAAAGLTAQAPGAFALVGMSALFAVAFRAPVTAMLLGIELTRDYGMVPALMFACIVAHLAAHPARR